jgi:hypothetical protein
VEARASALSLHSFFSFMGQTIGPIAYGFGILNVGKIPDRAGERRHHCHPRFYLRAFAETDQADGRGGKIGRMAGSFCH